ncbi:hypothetical protein AWB77_04497 [Caballeronia fortuita]|uniref:Ribosomal protein S14 n=1 Tax=Caballeronia fortuita TaxID=1777138 RepID=A0A158CSZ4_9BURK|nr:hypothetical protein AWB77_04497 [Caballeronia fortuita]
MQSKECDRDPWEQILESLPSFDEDARGRNISTFRSNTQHYDANRLTSAVIHVVDRPTDQTVIIYWSDASRCVYKDQLWRLSRAKRNGICALTNQRVAKGDSIFCPSTKGSKPVNHDMMILSNAVPSLMPYK